MAKKTVIIKRSVVSMLALGLWLFFLMPSGYATETYEFVAKWGQAGSGEGTS